MNATVLERSSGVELTYPVRRMAATARKDHDLLRLVAGGDEDAMRTLHAEYGSVMFGVIRRFVQDRSTAEDVFQQVMLEVWQRAESYDERRGPARTWLLTLARSRAIDELRRRRPAPMDPQSLPDVAIEGGEDDLIAEWEMAHSLDQLPHEERRLLEMRFRLDMTQSEISEHTGMPLGTIKTRMNRGLNRLREMMVADDRGAE